MPAPGPARRPGSERQLRGPTSSATNGVRMDFQRITIDPEQMGGVACLRGLRIPAASVVAMVADGMSRHEILAAYPDLEPGDIREALFYAADAITRRVLPVNAEF